MITNRRCRGFSLVEVLSFIAILGIIAAISIPLVRGVKSGTEQTAATTDIATVNRAVQAYLASGGDLSKVKDPVEVLNKLKTRQTEEGSRTYVGFTGSLIDPRLTIVQAEKEKNGDSKKQIVWNKKDLKFEESSKGNGFSAFAIDPNLDGKDFGTEDRKVTSLSYNKDDGWVWAHVEKEATGQPGASTIPIGVPIDTAPPAAPKLLSPPIFSPPGGTFDVSELPFTLTLQNPNDAATWIVYSLNGGPETQYHGPITLTEDTSVVAYADGDPSLWKKSHTASASYKFQVLPDPEQLLPPMINLSSVEFDEANTRVTFYLANPNPSGSSKIRYIIAAPSSTLPTRSNWMEYIGGGTIQYSDYPQGFIITAYAESLDDLLYTDSPNAQRVVTSSFFGIPLDQNVLIVLDASSSMNRSFGGVSRYQAVIAETIRAIGQLPNNVKFNVAMFDQGIHWTDGSWTLHTADQNNKDSLIAQISAVENDSGTNYAIGLSLPLMFNPVPNSVIFLSDGQPSGSYSAEVAALKTAGLTVNTIGIGMESGDEDNLRAIATELGGQFVGVPAP